MDGFLHYNYIYTYICYIYLRQLSFRMCHLPLVVSHYGSRLLTNNLSITRAFCSGWKGTYLDGSGFKDVFLTHIYILVSNTIR